MKKIAIISFLLFFVQNAFCAEFGEYQYSKYLGIQQQLHNQRMMAIKRQRMYNQNPTRNIRFPSRNSQYPNISRNQPTYRISPQQRYSAQYYRRYYN